MGIESNEAAAMSPKDRTRSIDGEIARIAAAQHGVISSRQISELGISPRAVRDRVASGRLHRIHRGVFAVGHPKLTREGRWMAATLAGGPGSALSHRAAGAHHGLRAWNGVADLIVPSWRASTPAVRFHTVVLPPDEVSIVDGIPTTTVPRTIFDLASVLDRHGLEQIIREAEVRRLADPLSLPDLIQRHPGRRGVTDLRAVLGELSVGAGITREELEARFARFLDSRSFRRPERNAALTIGGRIVVADCLWRRERLIVELDGHAVHSRPAQIDADKERDRKLMLAGWRVIRITWRHLHEHPEKLAADLRGLLAAA
jgi:very-short-patch-repair endonuclease